MVFINQTEKQSDKIKRVYKSVQKERLRRGLSFFCVLMMVLSVGFILYKTVYLKEVNAHENNRQKSLYYDEADAEEERRPDVPEDMEDKFLRLYAQNPDIRGWITLLNTQIDYPVYQPPQSNPDYYLTHNALKQKSSHGAIYLDPRIDLGKKPRAMILYGHHMNDGSMFRDLTKYKSLAFYKENPVFSFDTVLEEGSWKIFSVFLVNTRAEHGEVFEYQRTSFSGDDDFLDHIGQLKSRSLVDTGIELNADDQLLLLSTCSYEHKDFRTVVAARRIRQNENPVVEAESAKLALNPVKPDVCAHCKHEEE